MTAPSTAPWRSTSLTGGDADALGPTTSHSTQPSDPGGGRSTCVPPLPSPEVCLPRVDLHGRLLALTLHQPWASALFARLPSGERLKAWETRSWPPLVHGWLAIHAGKSDEGRCLYGDEEIAPLLAASGLSAWDALPRGAVLGVVDLTGYYRTDDLERPAYAPAAREVSASDRLMGDFSPGRWIWRCANPIPFREPIPARGCQSLWWWTPPAGALEELMR